MRPSELLVPFFFRGTTAVATGCARVFHFARVVDDRECVFAQGVFNHERVSGFFRFHSEAQGFAFYGFGRDRSLDFMEIRLQTGFFAVNAVVVGTAGLHRNLERMSGLLGLGVAGLFLLVEEGGQRDRGQDSEDEHDDEELDQREAGLAVAVEPGAYLGPEILDKHQGPPRFLSISPEPRRVAATWCLSTPVVARPTPKIVP